MSACLVINLVGEITPEDVKLYSWQSVTETHPHMCMFFDNRHRQSSTGGRVCHLSDKTAARAIINQRYRLTNGLAFVCRSDDSHKSIIRHCVQFKDDVKHPTISYYTSVTRALEGLVNQYDTVSTYVSPQYFATLLRVARYNRMRVCIQIRQGNGIKGLRPLMIDTKIKDFFMGGFKNKGFNLTSDRFDLWFTN